MGETRQTLAQHHIPNEDRVEAKKSSSGIRFSYGYVRLAFVPPNILALDS